MSDEGKEIIVAASSAATKAGVDKLSGGMANFFAPHIAKKQAEAMQIKLQSMIDAEEKAKRAGYRIIWEQSNIESIAREIPEHMSPNSDDAEKAEKLRNMNPDVAARSADSCKHVSDKYMRTLWAKALAGEADNPGSFSIRTARILGDMDKKDAELFRAFCQFVTDKKGKHAFHLPLVYGATHPVYADKGINYNSLNELASLGLITYWEHSQMHDEPNVLFVYRGNAIGINLKFHPQKEKHYFHCGEAWFTAAGKELFPLVEPETNMEFWQFVVDKWRKEGLNPHQPPADILNALLK